MENMQKAVIMAGSVFMFIIALSVAMFSYTTVREVNDSILTSSENNARTAEYFIATTEDVERKIGKEEVIMSIYSMRDSDYSPDEVRVSNLVFTKEEFLTTNGENVLERRLSGIVDGNYSISYTFMDYNINNKPGKVQVVYNLISG